MAYVSSTHRPSGWALRDLLLHPLSNLHRHVQRRRVYVQTLRELTALSDRELSDLGLHRLMIPAVARDAAYGK